MEDQKFIDIIIRLIKLQDYCVSTHYCNNCPFRIDGKCAFEDIDGKALNPYNWDIREILYRYIGGKDND